MMSILLQVHPRFVQPTLGTTDLIWDHHQEPAHYDELISSSQNIESILDSKHAPSVPANSGPRVAALYYSGENPVNSIGSETYHKYRLGTMYGDHTVINANNQGLPTPQLTDTVLERPAASGRYPLGASHASPTSTALSTIPFPTRGNTTQNKRIIPGASSHTSGANLVWDGAVSTSFAGPSNSDSAIRRNATQMKRALSEASSRTALARPQKKIKGDMDPVRISQPQLPSFKRLQESPNLISLDHNHLPCF